MADLYRITQDDSGPNSIHLLELILPIQMDAAEFDRLNETIVKTADKAADQRWVVDLSQADYIGSALLGLLVNIRQRIKTAGGRLILCGLSDHFGKAMKTCSLHNLFTIKAKRDEALKTARSM